MIALRCRIAETEREVSHVDASGALKAMAKRAAMVVQVSNIRHSLCQPPSYLLLLRTPFSLSTLLCVFFPSFPPYLSMLLTMLLVGYYWQILSTNAPDMTFVLVASA